jgi:hypothetical protein
MTTISDGNIAKARNYVAEHRREDETWSEAALRIAADFNEPAYIRRALPEVPR